MEGRLNPHSEGVGKGRRSSGLGGNDPYGLGVISRGYTHAKKMQKKNACISFDSFSAIFERKVRQGYTIFFKFVYFVCRVDIFFTLNSWSFVMRSILRV